MAGKLVIVAEDDELLRNLYERKFSMAGFRILTAENGDIALKLLEENTPDLLILDINMPGMDGFQVLEKFPPEDRSFPILMLSNFTDEQNQEKAKALKVDKFFEKQNTTIKDLIAVTEEMMGLE